LRSFSFFLIKNETKEKRNLLDLGIDPGTCDRVGSRFLVPMGRFQVPKNEDPVPDDMFQVSSRTCREPGTAHPYIPPHYLDYLIDTSFYEVDKIIVQNNGTTLGWWILVS